MATSAETLPACVARYAGLFHAAAGPGHHVGSPLGAWLVLALCAPAAEGRDAAHLADLLGCDPPAAAAAAMALLADPHPAVHAAAAAWARPALLRPGWLAGLPAAVARGGLPPQRELDRWAREHTLGLIRRFPLEMTPDTVLILASAMATRVSWQQPFRLAPGAALGPASPWQGRLSQVLRAPSGAGHEAWIAPTSAGDVAVHAAQSADGLAVYSVIGAPGAAAAAVLAAAHEVVLAGPDAPRRSLFDLPPGDGPAWLIREERGSGPREQCTAVLPAWSADTVTDLADPALGFGAAARAVAPQADRWTARQAAMARYSRTGFEAAAVTALVIRTAARPTRPRRVAELRFGHPYAVVAIARPAPEGATGGNGAAGGLGPGAGGPSSWPGVPVFSAWIAEPEDAAPPAVDEASG